MSETIRNAVELPRRHDLAPRLWQQPDGTITGEAINQEAIELLRRDPDEYFERTRPTSGLDKTTSQDPDY